MSWILHSSELHEGNEKEWAFAIIPQVITNYSNDFTTIISDYSHRFPTTNIHRNVRQKWIEVLSPILPEETFPSDLSKYEICSRHFKSKDFSMREIGKSYLLATALPSEHLGDKSFVTDSLVNEGFLKGNIELMLYWCHVIPDISPLQENFDTNVSGVRPLWTRNLCFIKKFFRPSDEFLGKFS